MEDSYKVYYFNGNGRAANLRAILSYAKAKWENVKINFEDWPVRIRTITCFGSRRKNFSSDIGFRKFPS